MTKTKLIGLQLPSNIRRSVRPATSNRNFFSDLKEATVEVEAHLKDRLLATRLISERAVRRLKARVGD